MFEHESHCQEPSSDNFGFSFLESLYPPSSPLSTNPVPKRNGGGASSSSGGGGGGGGGAGGSVVFSSSFDGGDMFSDARVKSREKKERVREREREKFFSPSRVRPFRLPAAQVLVGLERGREQESEREIKSQPRALLGTKKQTKKSSSTSIIINHTNTHAHEHAFCIIENNDTRV